jgi:uncharacterized protein YdiU (UPF0061 family)|tara:strand:- start:246 stop:431 length:186 start_codon:yes stop_codon:yes gene_type:complete
MIEHEELGMKVAEDKEEELIIQTIEAMEKSQRDLELQLELLSISLIYLKKKRKPETPAKAE